MTRASRGSQAHDKWCTLYRSVASNHQHLKRSRCPPTTSFNSCQTSYSFKLSKVKASIPPTTPPLHQFSKTKPMLTTSSWTGRRTRWSWSRPSSKNRGRKWVTVPICNKKHLVRSSLALRSQGIKLIRDSRQAWFLPSTVLPQKLMSLRTLTRRLTC